MPPPTPTLDPSDPVVLQVCRYAGAIIGPGGDLENCDGLLLADLIAVAYENREELWEMPALRSGKVLRSDRDGWPANTTVERDFDTAITPEDASQSYIGTWVIGDADIHSDEEMLFLTGYSYDMHATAAGFLEVWAARLKMQFTFNDGSGTYNVESKYQHVLELARLQKAQARPRDVQLIRSDTQGAGDDEERFFADQGGW